MKNTKQNAIATFRYLFGQKPRVGDCYYSKKDFLRLVWHKICLRKYRPYSCHSFRITHFYKIRPIQLQKVGQGVDAIFAQMHNERILKLQQKGVFGYLVYCRQSEASHVEGAGVCGDIARICDCVIRGTVRGIWSEDHVKESEESADRYAEKDQEIMFDKIYVDKKGRQINLRA